MANKTEKMQIMNVLKSAAGYLTGGDTSTFVARDTRYGVWMHATLDVVDSEGGHLVGPADFSVYFQWDLPLIEYTIAFRGSRSHYLNRKHGLRDILADRVHTALAKALVEFPDCYHLIYEAVAA